MARTVTVTPLEDDTLKRVAHIIPGGAAQQALDDLVRRRAAGETVVAYQVVGSDTILVGPVIEPQRTA